MQTTATKIVQKLQENGFLAYFVGGCVRDIILHHEPKDYDIVTDATPEQIEKLFRTAFKVGRKFGITLVIEAGHTIEVATFRKDLEYKDGRRPAGVVFSSPKIDAFRRDFTINAIFYDPVKKSFIDLVNGRSDLRRGILRFIGDPEARILEDFLRILRAVRFKNRFGLTYHSETKKALQRHASLVVEIAEERILDELNKMIVHKFRSSAFQDLFEFGILEKLFSQVFNMSETVQPLDHHQEGNVLTHTFLALHNMPEGECLALYWAVFFHDYAKPQTRKFEDGIWHYPGHDRLGVLLVDPILKKLKFPKHVAEKILWLLSHKQIFEDFEVLRLSKKFLYFDHKYFEDLWKLEKYDLLGCVAETPKNKQQALERLNRIYENYRYARDQKFLPSQQNEFFSGEVIMKMTGLSAGKRIGQIKRSLRELQIEGKIQNRTDAEKWIMDNEQ